MKTPWFILLIATLWITGPRDLAAADSDAVFADTFDNELAAGWSWLREDPGTWRIRDGALEIRVLPGNAQTVRNALVRPAPNRAEGAFAVEVTVRNHRVPTEQYEQAGITWYLDGQPVFKLVKELVDGVLMMIPGRQPMDTSSVRLRLIVRADSYVAQYRPEGSEEFLTAATGALPPPKNDQVSLQCYHGPTAAEHWIQFDNFVIRRVKD